MSVILPGSYDPVTLGHVDIIRRVAEQEDEVYAVIFINPDKEYMFSLCDRVAMLMLATEDIENCIVSYSLGRVVDYMREHDIDKIVKGVRDDTDRLYEAPQAEYNMLHGGYNTDFIQSHPDFVHISSSRVRDALLSGEDITSLVGERVANYIKSLKM